MEIKSTNDIQFKEYVVQLEPEDEQVLLEIGREHIIKDKQQCISYAVQKLLEWYMVSDKSDFTDDNIMQLFGQAKGVSR